MMHRTCDICGKEICKAPFGEIDRTMREESRSRTSMRIITRNTDSETTKYDDVCLDCTEAILEFIASRKEGRK